MDSNAATCVVNLEPTLDTGKLPSLKLSYVENDDTRTHGPLQRLLSALKKLFFRDYKKPLYTVAIELYPESTEV